MIYLDNAATTRCNKSTTDVVATYCNDKFFNPSSTSHQSILIKEEIEDAKSAICKIFGVKYDGKNFIFTSTATEANNIALQGACNRFTKQIIVSKGEHPSVYNVAKQIEGKGVDVKFLNLQKNGQIDYEELEEMLSSQDTSIISVMLVNNETGAINDISRICALRDKYQPNCLIHCDCVQAFGKIKFNAKHLGIDMLTISSHKIGGPKGVGGLYFNNKCKLHPLIYGGGQELNLKSGTENAPAIMGFAHAAKLSAENMSLNFEHVNNLKQAFLNKISDFSYQLNSNNECSPYILSVSFAGIRSETLINMLQSFDIIISAGSACSSKKVGNRVLEAMGVKNIIGSVRISFSNETTLDDVVFAAEKINLCYNQLYTNTH